MLHYLVYSSTKDTLLITPKLPSSKQALAIGKDKRSIFSSARSIEPLVNAVATQAQDLLTRGRINHGICPNPNCLSKNTQVVQSWTVPAGSYGNTSGSDADYYRHECFDCHEEYYEL